MTTESKNTIQLNVIDLMRVVIDADRETRGFALRGTTNWAAHIGKAVQRAVLAKGGTLPAGADEVAEHYRNAITSACEGWTMPDGLRKHLETALWSPPTQRQAGAVPLTESEMGEGWRKFQETLDDLMAADPVGVRNMGREHWLSWAHWKAACRFAHDIKGGQHGAE